MIVWTALHIPLFVEFYSNLKRTIKFSNCWWLCTKNRIIVVLQKMTCNCRSPQTKFSCVLSSIGLRQFDICTWGFLSKKWSIFIISDIHDLATNVDAEQVRWITVDTFEKDGVPPILMLSATFKKLSISLKSFNATITRNTLHCTSHKPPVFRFLDYPYTLP